MAKVEGPATVPFGQPKQRGRKKEDLVADRRTVAYEEVAKIFQITDAAGGPDVALTKDLRSEAGKLLNYNPKDRTSDPKLIAGELKVQEQTSKGNPKYAVKAEKEFFDALHKVEEDIERGGAKSVGDAFSRSGRKIVRSLKTMVKYGSDPELEFVGALSEKLRNKYPKLAQYMNELLETEAQYKAKKLKLAKPADPSILDVRPPQAAEAA